MIVQKDFLNKLKDFGLNSYEAKLWTALLSRGVATAGELSDIANVPRSRSYDVLESLEKKGFVIMKLGKPIKYIAIPPAEVIERVKKHVKESADQQSKIIESLKGSKVLDELENLHKNGIDTVEPADLTGAVKGRDNLYSHLSSMIKNAKKSVLVVTTEEGLIRKAKSLRLSLQKAKDRGVKVQILAPLTKKNEQAVSQLSGFEVKHIPSVQSRYVIVDGKQLTFMVLDDNAHPNNDFGVWICHEPFVATFEKFFSPVKK
jgi:sugar-specific transcriptional regulator TrmB